jgi:hypothetical protein
MKTLKTSLVILAAVSAFGLPCARADQPHMKAAVRHLRAAQEELRAAEHNKGGWRERALEHVNKAISETERGMSAAR